MLIGEVAPSPKFHSQAVIGQTGDVVVLVRVNVTGAWLLLGEVSYVKPALGSEQLGVGVGVAVAAGVGVGVAPGVPVGAAVGVGVGVGLGVGVAVDAGVDGTGRVSIWLVEERVNVDVLRAPEERGEDRRQELEVPDDGDGHEVAEAGRAPGDRAGDGDVGRRDRDARRLSPRAAPGRRSGWTWRWRDRAWWSRCRRASRRPGTTPRARRW